MHEHKHAQQIGHILQRSINRKVLAVVGKFYPKPHVRWPRSCWRWKVSELTSYIRRTQINVKRTLSKCKIYKDTYYIFVQNIRTDVKRSILYMSDSIQFSPGKCALVQVANKLSFLCQHESVHKFHWDHDVVPHIFRRSLASINTIGLRNMHLSWIKPPLRMLTRGQKIEVFWGQDPQNPKWWRLWLHHGVLGG